MSAQHTPGHKLRSEGPHSHLASWWWHCECGKWSAKTPKVGLFGHTTDKARIAQVEVAHRRHVRAAAAKATEDAHGIAPAGGIGGDETPLDDSVN